MSNSENTTYLLCPFGGVKLTFRVADLREVKRKVLNFGADVQVAEPEALRRAVGEEVAKMAEMYGVG